MYSFGRAALLLLVEVQNHTVPVRERRRIGVNKVFSSLRHNLPSSFSKRFSRENVLHIPASVDSFSTVLTLVIFGNTNKL